MRIDLLFLQKKIIEGRKHIFQHGKTIRSQAVEQLLGNESLVPVEVGFNS